MGESHYEVLGVARDATAAQIKKAYRKAALEWHPDKNPSPQAEERFVRIGQAYEVLGNEDSRRQYDRYGSSVSTGYHGGAGGGGFDFAQARRMFDENFGEALAKQWSPGMRITGKRVQNGKAFTMTIHPDGTTEEEEVDAASSNSYQYVKRTSASGVTSVSINVNSFGDILTALVPGLSLLPTPVSVIVMSVLSWLPTFLMLFCCYRCCCGKRKPPAASAKRK